MADGSRTLYPSAASCAPNSSSGSCRANIEWRTSFYGPAGSTQVRRRTILDAYVSSGETIDVGSSAVGVGSGDVTVFDPGVVSDPSAEPLPTVTTGVNGFRCSDQRTSSGIAAQGMITSRALELAGPQAVTGGGNPGGYVPCHYTAPATGIYSIVFYGPDGDGVDTDGGALADINLANANNFNAAQLATIAAWDVTIRANDTSVTDINGRLFTTALAASTAGNGRPLNITFYVTTNDGFVYEVQTRGLDPNGFALYGNQLGFLDADGSGPLDHDVLGTTNSSQLTGLAGNVALAAPQYPISFTPLAPETLAALGIPTTPVSPAINTLSFAGSVGGNTSVVGQGGTFHYTTTTQGVTEIIISRNGSDFDPGNPLNRVLRVTQSAGAHTLGWDGKDNSGNDLPIGANYQVRADLHAGEYHFPLLDAENSTLGGPTITLQNPPGGTCPFGNSSCTTAFYDDRGYHTSGGSGSDVGTPGATLCGLNPEPTNHSDPTNGYDSSGSQRAYGADTGGNTNVPCTGSFGDVKGLDTWTYYPSANTNSALNIINVAPPAPVATDDGYTAAYQTPLVTAAPGVLGNDTGTGITVTAHTNPAHGTVTQNADGSFTYTPANGYAGSDSYSYTISDSFTRTSTATVNITVQPPPGPVATDDSYNAVYGTARVVRAGTGVLANDTGTGITVTAHTNPAHGTVTQHADGSFTYKPASGYAGSDSYSYTITDRFGRTSNATVTLVVQPPAKPAATDDAYTTAYQTPLVTPAPGVLANDTGTGITVTAHTNPTHGTVTQHADGSFTYTPANGYAGRDSYSYTITDSFGRVSTATVTLTVDPPPGTPPPPTNPPTQLPFTGSASDRLSLFALLLVVAGAVISTPKRRRNHMYAPTLSAIANYDPSHGTSPPTHHVARFAHSIRGHPKRRRTPPRE